jgi:staphylococcal nuclease domain-containing protein 1
MVLTLSGLQAPRLPSSGPSGQQAGQTEEPFAWESREFLRKLTVGQQVQFTANLKPSSGSSAARGFGSVSLRGESVALAVAKAGWAKAKPQAEAAVVEAAAEAEAKQIGVFDPAEKVREVNWTTASDPAKAAAFLAQHKSVPTRVVIEAVRQGNELRAVALEGMCMLNLHIAGITCPRYNAPARPRDVDAPPPPPNGEEKRPISAAEKIAAAAPRAPSDPGALEAKWFTELRLLQREVDVALHGSDAFGNLQATILHPKGNIAVEILRAGLGRTMNYGLSILPKADSEALVAAETSARASRKGVWGAAAAAPRAAAAPGPASSSGPTAPSGSSSFSATVVEIMSGDQIVVHGPRGEVRLALASIRAPRVGNARRSVPDEALAAEAKEALRSKAIGKQVMVAVEYERVIPQGEQQMDSKRPFATVIMTKGSKKIDLAEYLVSEGLATVQRHRPGEDRSCSYDALLAAEADAREKKKGLHSGTPQPPSSAAPLDLMGDFKRARAYLTSLQRNGVMRATVEVVFSGSRFKVVVPRENMSFALALSAVRCPNPVRSGPSARAAEPMGEEAKAFSRKHALQRTVSIEVVDMDRNGVALGHMWMGQGPSKEHFGAALLRAGLATCDDRALDRMGAEGHNLRACEEEAKAAGHGVWSEAAQGPAAVQKEAQEPKLVVDEPEEAYAARLSDIVDGGNFYVRPSDPKYAETDRKIEEALAKLTEAENAKTSSSLSDARRGDVVAASFNDGSGPAWYRAAVEARGAGGSLLIRYMDHGNTSLVAPAQLRRLDPVAVSLPPRARACSLAFTRVPALGEEWGADAASALQDMAWGKELRVQKLGRDAEGRDMVLLKVAQEDKSINEQLVAEGVARLDRRAAKTSAAKSLPGADLLKKMSEAQDAAHRGRVAMWRYGDCASDDEEGV